MKKLNHIGSAMRNHVLVYAIVGALIAFGMFALPKMNKDEFPQFTLRIGVIAAIYPGATAQEVQEQVAKPLEQYLFTFNEVNKARTYSRSRDGICYIYTVLRTVNSVGLALDFNEDASPIKSSPCACFRRVLIIDRARFMTEWAVILMRLCRSCFYADMFYTICIIEKNTVLNNSVLDIEDFFTYCIS